MKKIKIVIPLFNDWKSLERLLENINLQISKSNLNISIIVVNDGSIEEKKNISNQLENIKSIKILHLKKNIGHARCIATGLKYIFDNEDFDFVIPMDSDGEDRPEEIVNFLDLISKNTNKVIVGERIKRSENMFFKFSYIIHKLITYTFTGRSIKFGNYTCLPKSTVEKMINNKSTWSSYSGTLSKIENELVKSPSIRGVRYYGPSKMSFFNLIKHSLSIIAVFKLNVFIRSTLFLIVYFYLVSQNITFITIIPIIFLIAFLIFILLLSRRENLEELKNSEKNIKNLEIIK